MSPSLFHGDPCNEDHDAMEHRPAGGGGGAVTWLIASIGAAVLLGSVVSWAFGQERDDIAKTCLPGNLPSIESYDALIGLDGVGIQMNGGAKGVRDDQGHHLRHPQGNASRHRDRGPLEGREPEHVGPGLQRGQGSSLAPDRGRGLHMGRVPTVVLAAILAPALAFAGPQDEPGAKWSHKCAVVYTDAFKYEAANLPQQSSAENLYKRVIVAVCWWKGQDYYNVRTGTHLFREFYADGKLKREGVGGWMFDPGLYLHKNSADDLKYDSAARVVVDATPFDDPYTEE